MTQTSQKAPDKRAKHAGTLVRIKEYNPSKHLVKVTRASGGEPLENDGLVLGEVTQTKPYTQRSAKVLKFSEKSDGPIVEVTDDVASVRGSKDTGIYSTEKFGNIITGPLSIAAAPQDIRLSGINKLNPLLSSGFPSTIVTPIPVCLFDFPGAKSVGPIMKDVLTMGILVAALGVA